MKRADYNFFKLCEQTCFAGDTLSPLMYNEFNIHDAKPSGAEILRKVHERLEDLCPQS